VSPLARLGQSTVCVDVGAAIEPAHVAAAPLTFCPALICAADGADSADA
jgi:hypothetical protein